MELLPAERDVQISYKRGVPEERELSRYDAVLIACERERAPDLIRKLPLGAAWRRAYEDARASGAVTLLTLKSLESAKPIALAFLKNDASAFERLTFAARAWKELNAGAAARVLLGAVGFEQGESAGVLDALLTATLAATASMPTMKAKPLPRATKLDVTVLHQYERPDLARAVAVDRGNHVARWLTTLPPNVLDSASYRRALRALARANGWQFSFLDEAALQRRGAGAFLAVSRANEHRDAGIVRLRRRAPGRTGAQARLTLVGKGVCFDTGGVNLKTHKSMYHMHEDMQGSAVAVGALLALSALDVPYEIDCWLALTENQIGARAFRPQEVVRASNGVTIQVVHSDAEGRMILADALALAARETPDLIIDFATLTGACVVALGDRYSGAFTNRADLRPVLELAGRESGERVWPFPMDEDYDSELESAMADVMQCTPDSKADHILAARFLNRFVPAEIPWIHIDLAASNRTGGLAHIPTDFTGFGVRFAAHLLLDHDILSRSPKVTRRTRRSQSRGGRKKPASA